MQKQRLIITTFDWDDANESLRKKLFPDKIQTKELHFIIQVLNHPSNTLRKLNIQLQECINCALLFQAIQSQHVYWLMQVIAKSSTIFVYYRLQFDPIDLYMDPYNSITVYLQSVTKHVQTQLHVPNVYIKNKRIKGSIVLIYIHFHNYTSTEQNKLSGRVMAYHILVLGLIPAAGWSYP